MKCDLNWLSEWVAELPPAEELAQSLTMAGLEVDDHHDQILELELTPFVEQAEFTSGFIRVSYWEGAVSVAGQRGGQSVTGWGFVELVGYDPKQLETTPTPQQQ